MAVTYIKLKNNSETIYFQSILGTYTHLAWVRTEYPEEGIIKVISTPDTDKAFASILNALREEIEFDEVDPPSP